MVRSKLWNPEEVRAENEVWAQKYRPLLKKRDQEKAEKREYAKHIWRNLTDEQQAALRPYINLDVK